LRDFHVEEMRCMKRLALAEKTLGPAGAARRVERKTSMTADASTTTNAGLVRHVLT